MKKVLIAVDSIKDSKAVLTTYLNLVRPAEEVLLLTVERLEGKSLMIDMLGDAELSTLRESVRDTDHKEKLDKKAAAVLDHYRREISENSRANVKAVVREGLPAEEILKAAEEEKAELIILGNNRKKGFGGRFLTGSIAKDVERDAKVPVLIAKAARMCEEPYSWKDAYAAVTVTTAIIFGMFLLGVFIQKGTFLH